MRKGICKIDDCTEIIILAKDMCSKHYHHEYWPIYKANNRELIRLKDAKSNSDKRAKLFKSYQLQPGDLEFLIARQNGLCAICGTDDPKGRHGTLNIDHDHDTGRVRGMLCSACNRGLGMIGDSVEILRAAIDYLEAPPIIFPQPKVRRVKRIPIR